MTASVLRTGALAMVLVVFVSGHLTSAQTTARFKTTDLTTLKAAPVTLSGKTFVTRAEPKRLTYACHDCADLTAIDVLIDTSTDGTEARLRSGETRIETIEQNCRAREPDCRITGITVQGATGWVSKTVAVGNPVSTTVLFKGGDRLVIRSIAPDIDAAYRNGQDIIARIGPEIIGE